MTELTEAQKRAIENARARSQGGGMSEAQRNAIEAARQRTAPKERSIGDVIYDNIVGNPDDGVQSYGESLGTWLNRAGETATLGVVGDEASAAVTGMLPGRSYESEVDRYRGNEENMSTAGRVSADIAGSVGPALAGIGAVSGAASLGGATMRGMGLGAAAGGTQAFTEGEGNASERMGGVLPGAGIGGTIGAAIPGAAALGKSLVKGGAGAVRNSRIGRSIANELGVTPGTGRVVSRLVGEESPQNMRSALQTSGDNAMLADASPNMSGMLDASMRNPAPGAQIARQRVDDRAAGAYDDVVDALRGGQQGPRMPPVANQRAMGAAARPTINPLYREAYDTPIDYASEQGRAIEDVVSRLPPRQAQAAINQANEAMIWDQMPNKQIMAQVGDDGRVAFQEMPNVQQLDYIKRAFDDIAEDSKDAITGRMTSEGRQAANIASSIRNATRDAVPKYGEALRAAASDTRQRGAVRTGQALLRPQTSVEDAVESIGDATEAELRAMREGVLGQVEHIMGNVRAVASDQNVDARQASRLYAELSSPNAKRKMQALFGDDWPEIERQLGSAGQALGLRARVAGNSATQPRQAADQLISDEIAPSALQQFEPFGTIKQMGQRAVGSDPASISRLSDEVKAELAELLTRQGSGASQTLDSVVGALQRNPVNPARGQNIEKILMGLGFGGLPAQSEQLRRRLAQ